MCPIPPVDGALAYHATGIVGDNVNGVALYRSTLCCSGLNPLLWLPNSAGEMSGTCTRRRTNAPTKKVRGGIRALMTIDD